MASQEQGSPGFYIPGTVILVICGYVDLGRLGISTPT